MERLNAEALAALTGQHNVQVARPSRGLIARGAPAGARRAGRAGARSAAARKVHDSYVAFRERTAAWSRISIKAVLEAREG